MNGNRALGGVSWRANMALVLGLASVAMQVVGRIVNGADDRHAWIWFVMAGLGFGAMAAGFLARTAGRIERRADLGMVLGGLMVLLFFLDGTGIL